MININDVDAVNLALMQKVLVCTSLVPLIFKLRLGVSIFGLVWLWVKKAIQIEIYIFEKL